MPKKASSYVRVCKNCGKDFRTLARFGKVCDDCKSEISKKIVGSRIGKYK